MNSHIELIPIPTILSANCPIVILDLSGTRTGTVSSNVLGQRYLRDDIPNNSNNIQIKKNLLIKSLISKQIESYIIDFLISIIVGYVLYLIFEGPAQRLIEIINSRDPMFDESYSYDLEQKKPPKQKASRRQAEQAMTDVASQCKNNENFPEKSEVISIRF